LASDHRANLLAETAKASIGTIATVSFMVYDLKSDDADTTVPNPRVFIPWTIITRQKIFMGAGYLNFQDRVVFRAVPGLAHRAAPSRDIRSG
jgi:hypothetical protein